MAPHPLGRLLPDTVAHALQHTLENKGVQWHLGTGIERTWYDEASDTVHCLCDNGTTIVSDIAISAIGLAPLTQLASDAGLTTERGIIVNEYLQSSDPHIYALGDCAQIDGMVRPFIAPLMSSARCIAHTLCGQQQPLELGPMPVVVKTPSLPIVVCPPAPNSTGKWSHTGSENNIRAEFTNEQGDLLGFALCGDACADKDQLHNIMANNKPMKTPTHS